LARIDVGITVQWQSVAGFSERGEEEGNKRWREKGKKKKKKKKRRRGEGNPSFLSL